MKDPRTARNNLCGTTGKQRMEKCLAERLRRNNQLVEPGSEFLLLTPGHQLLLPGDRGPQHGPVRSRSSQANSKEIMKEKNWLPNWETLRMCTRGTRGKVAMIMRMAFP